MNLCHLAPSVGGGGRCPRAFALRCRLVSGCPACRLGVYAAPARCAQSYRHGVVTRASWEMQGGRLSHKPRRRDISRAVMLSVGVAPRVRGRSCVGVARASTHRAPKPRRSTATLRRGGFRRAACQTHWSSTRPALGGNFPACCGGLAAVRLWWWAVCIHHQRLCTCEPSPTRAA